MNEQQKVVLDAAIKWKQAVDALQQADPPTEVLADAYFQAFSDLDAAVAKLIAREQLDSGTFV